MVGVKSVFHYDSQQLDEAARLLQEAAGDLRVWVFRGEMGAGKTTLIKSIAKQLGVKETVQSPTFSIVNEYSATERKVFHFDFYRIKKEEEAVDIGVEEYLYSDNFCFIEWPEKIPSLLPDAFFEIAICVEANGFRKLEYRKNE
jgi:tRNA threonylcarbamoyladenosine biosynthesis protein TsaE